MMKLEISGLSFSYGERQVLEDISFGVAEGEFVSLLGPSGCGKSTVLKLLTGILSPDRGRILVDGKEIRGLSSHFAYMPQNRSSVSLEDHPGQCVPVRTDPRLSGGNAGAGQGIFSCIWSGGV